MSALIGIDIGGTNTVCGLVRPSGEVTARSKFPTDPSRGPDALLEQLAREAKRLAEEAGIPWEEIEAVGLGIPGIVDPVRGESILAVNLGWKGIPVGERLRTKLGKPVAVDNDVKMYVYGEAMLGAGRGYEHVFGITIGTGLASALVTNGELYYGSGFLAGEFGHIPIDGETERCNCGLVGCLETVVSATGIARLARQALENGGDSLLRSASGSGKISSADVSAACTAGDALAAGILERVGRTLGRALSYVVPVISPDIIIVGGGGAQAGPPLFKPMQEELENRLLSFYRDRLRIEPARLGDDAGVIGSALKARQMIG